MNIKRIFILISTTLVLLLTSCEQELVNVEEIKEQIKPSDNLDIISLSEISLKLIWRDNSQSEISFDIERGEGTDPQAWITIGEVPANITEFVDNNLNNDNIYSYRIKSVGNYSVFEYSNSIAVKCVYGKLIRSFQGHTSEILTMALSPNGQLLATAGRDNTIILWNIISGNQILQLTEHYKVVNSLDFSANGEVLSSCSDDGWLILWNPQTGDIIRKIEVFGGTPQCVTISNDGSKVGVGLSSQLLRIYNTSTGEIIHTLNTGNLSSAGITSVDFSPDGKKILGFYKFNEIRMWDLSNGNQLWVIQTNQALGGYVSFNNDGEYFAIGYSSTNESVELRRSNNGSIVKILGEYLSSCYFVSFNSDSKRIVAALYNCANIWNVDTGELLYSIPENNGIVASALLTPDNQKLITANNFSSAVNNIYQANLWKLESNWVVIP